MGGDQPILSSTRCLTIIISFNIGGRCVDAAFSRIRRLIAYLIAEFFAFFIMSDVWSPWDRNGLCRCFLIGGGAFTMFTMFALTHGRIQRAG